MATIRSYLNKGGDPNAKYRNESGLAVALGRQNPEAARLLLATKGIKVNEWNTKLDVVSRTYSTLMNAVAYPDIVKILLERGVDLDRRESWSEPGESLRIGDTALLIAIGNHNSESVKLLIDHGATLNLTSGKGETALVRAISRATHGQGTDGLPQIVPENPDIVKLLLDKGANVEQLSKSADGHTAATPLGRAAALGNLETAKLLIHGGAKVQALDSIGYPALFHATKVEMAKLLIDNGAPIAFVAHDSGSTPMSCFIEASNAELLSYLLDKGAQVNPRGAGAFSPLMLACSILKPEEGKCINIMSILLERGALVNQQQKDSGTALMVVCHGALERVKRVELLLAKGANLDLANAKGQTALMLATVKGHSEIVKVLLAKGANCELQDTEGETALMLASAATEVVSSDYGKYTQIVALLLDHGAKLEAHDQAGNSAIYYAQRYQRKLSADLLLAKGAKRPANTYVKTSDKQNVSSKIVGVWECKVQTAQSLMITRFTFNADYSYGKTIAKTFKAKLKPQLETDSAKTYDVRGNCIYVGVGEVAHPRIYEWYFNGDNLVLNGEKYVKIKAPI